MKGAGVPLVAVADHVLRRPFGPAAVRPLRAGRESRAPAPAQARGLDFGNDLLRLHPGEGLAQGPVPADGNVILDPGGVDPLILTQEQARLRSVEGDFRGRDDLPAALRVLKEKAVDDLARFDGFGNDGGDVLRLYFLVEDIIGVNGYEGAQLAESRTARGFQNGGHLQFPQFPLESLFHLLAAIGLAARAAADGDDPFVVAPGRKDFLLPLLQTGSGFDLFHALPPFPFF